MGLVIKYKFYGFLIGLLIVFIFFIWYNLGSVFPVSHDKTATGPSIYRNTSNSFTSLLSAHISEKSLFALCVNEWEKQNINHPELTEEIKVYARNVDKENITVQEKYNRLLALINTKKDKI